MRDKRLGFDSFSHFYAVYKRGFLIYTIWSERSRSARSRGRSARRSATPDRMLERKAERNSEIAGALARARAPTYMQQKV